MRTCKVCGESGDESGFATKFRCFSCYVACREAKWARNRAKHAEQRRQYMRDRYAADPEVARESLRRSYAAHRESRAARVREYVAQNKDVVRERKQDYYQRNKERIKAAVRARHAANPERAAIRNRHRKVQRAYRGSLPLVFHTEAEWQAKLAIFGGRCAHCGTDQNITRDHIIPLQKGGADTIDNIQPLCKSCNSKKGTKVA